jgi:hypothetical protein
MRNFFYFFSKTAGFGAKRKGRVWYNTAVKRKKHESERDLMPNRRMFSCRLMRSDAFLDLGPESQLLYLHLCMEADDDGFLHGRKRITRMLGFPEDVYRALVTAGFLIEFESGAAAVTHWHACNSMRKDRYTPTQYREEFAMLDLLPDGRYILKTEAPKPAETEPENPTGTHAVNNAPPAPAAGPETTDVPPEPAGSAPGADLALPLSDGGRYRLSPQAAADLCGAYPEINVREELYKLRGWLLQRPEKQRAAPDTERLIGTWMENARSRAANARCSLSPESPAARARGYAPESPPSYDIDAAEYRINTTVPKLKKKNKRLTADNA